MDPIITTPDTLDTIERAYLRARALESDTGRRFATTGSWRHLAIHRRAIVAFRIARERYNLALIEVDEYGLGRHDPLASGIRDL